MLPYLENKEEKYKKILSFIKDDSKVAKKRKEEVIEKINFIENLKKGLK